MGGSRRGGVCSSKTAGSWQKTDPIFGSELSERPAFKAESSGWRAGEFDRPIVDLVSLLTAVESSIQVGVNGPAVWVKVEGKGSFLNSGSFKEFAREMVDRGYRKFVIDLAKCVMMDSTFMGTMAGVALRLKELGRGHLSVVHCGERSRELLFGLGLDQIFNIYSNGETAPECELINRDGTAGSNEDQKHQQ